MTALRLYDWRIVALRRSLRQGSKCQVGRFWRQGRALSRAQTLSTNQARPSMAGSSTRLALWMLASAAGSGAACAGRSEPSSVRRVARVRAQPSQLCQPAILLGSSPILSESSFGDVFDAKSRLLGAGAGALFLSTRSEITVLPAPTLASSLAEALRWSRPRPVWPVKPGHASPPTCSFATWTWAWSSRTMVVDLRS